MTKEDGHPYEVNPHTLDTVGPMARRMRTSLNGSCLKSNERTRTEPDGSMLTSSSDRTGSRSTDDFSEIGTSAEIASSVLYMLSAVLAAEGPVTNGHTIFTIDGETPP